MNEIVASGAKSLLSLLVLMCRVADVVLSTAFTDPLFIEWERYSAVPDKSTENLEECFNA
jgi:hypothetical protein